MIRHDFKCTKCGMVAEVTFDSSSDFRKEWPCANCGGVAVQIWLRAPGLAGVEEPSTRGVSRSFEPGYDIQSGRYFNTRSERDRYVKARGLELMGPQEWDRTRKAMPESPEHKVNERALEEAAQKAWERLQAGERPEPMEEYKGEDAILEAKEN